MSDNDSKIVTLDSFRQKPASPQADDDNSFEHPFDDDNVLIEIANFLVGMDFKSVSVCDRETGRAIHASRIEIDGREEFSFWSPDEGKKMTCTPDRS